MSREMLNISITEFIMIFMVFFGIFKQKEGMEILRKIMRFIHNARSEIDDVKKEILLDDEDHRVEMFDYTKKLEKIDLQNNTKDVQ